MKKNILIFIFIIFLTSVLGVFTVGSLVRADETTNATNKCNICPPGDNQIRLQIYVPGITNSCTYNVDEFKDGKIQPVEKKCYYIASNLPAYIKKLYSFSIGAIAIIAVIMIMIGGLRWIFAAGNASQIGEARQQITAAVAGLILALCSYVLLNAINPSLTKLTNINPTNVETIEQGTTWCADFPQYYNNNRNTPYVFYPEGQWGESGVALGSYPNYTFSCGVKYQWGYELGGAGRTLVELGKEQTCTGNYCGGEKVCYSEAGYSFCVDANKLCEDDTHKDYCTEVNEKIYASNAQSTILSKSCYKRIDDWTLEKGLGWADECAWNNIALCPQGWQRVNCLTPSIENACWKYNKDGKKELAHFKGDDSVEYLCSDSIYANIETSSICCREEGTDNYKLYAHSTGYPYPAIIDCENKDSCGDYITKDACERDICKVVGSCKWQTGTCVAQ